MPADLSPDASKLKEVAAKAALTMEMKILMAVAGILLLTSPCTAAASIESVVAHKFETKTGRKPTSVSLVSGLPLYEIVVGGKITYSDAEVTRLITGTIFDVEQKKNLTKLRYDELIRVDYSKLPISKGLKRVKGLGTNQFVLFSDANCGACKQLELELEKVNATSHTFMVANLSFSSRAYANAAWCAKDRIGTWERWMKLGEKPMPAAADCTPPTDFVTELARRLAVNGTPTIVFSDGTRHVGYLSAAELNEKLARVGKSITTAQDE